MEPMEALCQIVAADRAAREKYEAAKQENEGFALKLEEMRRQFEKEARQEADRTVEEVRKQSLDRAAEELRALDEGCEKELKEMADKFEAEGEAWSDAMVRMVVGLNE